jgi:hypothetical protein
MNSGLDDPEGTWPGVLLLEVPDQGLVVGETRSLAGLNEFDKKDLAARVLPNRIRTSKANRFAWVMPAWRGDAEPPVECLVVVMGEPKRTEAHLADVLRGSGRPVLAEWRGPTKRVEGLFAAPLARALLAKPRPAGRQRARRRREPKIEPVRMLVSPSGRPLLPNCPDCGAEIGEPHRPRCDVEPCSNCFRQRLTCVCAAQVGERAQRWIGTARKCLERSGSQLEVLKFEIIGLECEAGESASRAAATHGSPLSLRSVPRERARVPRRLRRHRRPPHRLPLWLRPRASLDVRPARSMGRGPRDAHPPPRSLRPRALPLAGELALTARLPQLNVLMHCNASTRRSKVPAPQRWRRHLSDYDVFQP